MGGKKRAQSQIGALTEHLLKYGSITSWEAVMRYGITRLSAYIYILRHDYHWEITAVNQHKQNRYGNATTFALYTVEKVGDAVE